MTMYDVANLLLFWLRQALSSWILPSLRCSQAHKRQFGMTDWGSDSPLFICVLFTYFITDSTCLNKVFGIVIVGIGILTDCQIVRIDALAYFAQLITLMPWISTQNETSVTLVVELSRQRLGPWIAKTLYMRSDAILTFQDYDESYIECPVWIRALCHEGISQGSVLTRCPVMSIDCLRQFANPFSTGQVFFRICWHICHPVYMK